MWCTKMQICFKIVILLLVFAYRFAQVRQLAAIIVHRDRFVAETDAILDKLYDRRDSAKDVEYTHVGCVLQCVVSEFGWFGW